MFLFNTLYTNEQTSAWPHSTIAVTSAPAPEPPPPKSGSFLISFNEILHDYGNVKPDSDNTAFFIVTNTGKKPLIIESVDASCGCTTPIKPEKPILPGKSDKIKVVFHPKPGQVGEQNKTVTVTANTDPRLTVLKIKAFVK